ncbi:hypothetical protein [Providencia rettgeri]|uniref:hypothetical protein n=1 Tax=Providencia rettgeri TaxID=587 RepID=UPI001E4E279D|nr:hypothetical protein LMY39_14285 [Providencia rettgeri]
MKSKRTSMRLVNFSRENSGRMDKVYEVRHESQKTILEQKLTIKRDDVGRFSIDIAMDDFPRIDNELDAMLKYADWLERMGIAIRREAKRAIKRGVE